VLQVDDVMLGVILYTVSTSVAAAGWVARLGTRVAVLEAGHDAMSDLLQEIRMDIKELVAALHGSELITRPRTPTKKKP